MDNELYDYLRELMPDAVDDVQVWCVGCVLTVPLASAVMRDGEAYCSANCADRSTACMVKPSPRGARIDGMDV